MANDAQALLQKALQVAKNAYAPYSKFCVGAAILGVDDNVYIGCNVENASYGLTICAERNAITTMVAQGCGEFKAIAIASKNAPETWPCGACRQILAEFCNPQKTPVYVLGKDGTVVTATVENLLPNAFTRANMD